MPDPKKPVSIKQLKTAPVVNSPRQRVLDSSARETGANLAGYRDGESYEMLKNAKAGVGHVQNSSLTKVSEGVFPWIGKQAMPDEADRYRKTMEAAYDETKEQIARKDGRPTGYDAAMRGTPSSSMSSAEALAKKKPLTAKQVATAPMFEKKK